MDSSGSGESQDVRGGPVAPATIPGAAGPIVHVATGAENTCALINNGDIHCWGNRESGAIGSPAGSVGVFPDPQAAFRLW